MFILELLQEYDFVSLSVCFHMTLIKIKVLMLRFFWWNCETLGYEGLLGKYCSFKQIYSLRQRKIKCDVIREDFLEIGFLKFSLIKSFCIVNPAKLKQDCCTPSLLKLFVSLTCKSKFLSLLPHHFMSFCVVTPSF